ncbi:hypothetical protein [Dyadobacter sp. BHUBP1]|uniref:hypothetical protein n=1 Tax=Dyadobacter sp. BHUBP1 TaxID=3424178 RepID=UPI003D32EBB4
MNTHELPSIKDRLLERFTFAKQFVGKNWRKVLAEHDPFFLTKTGRNYVSTTVQALSRKSSGQVDRIERVTLALEKLIGASSLDFSLPRYLASLYGCIVDFSGWKIGLFLFEDSGEHSFLDLLEINTEKFFLDSLMVNDSNTREIFIKKQTLFQYKGSCYEVVDLNIQLTNKPSRGIHQLKLLLYLNPVGDRDTNRPA